jgi:hypothetical protein
LGGQFSRAPGGHAEDRGRESESEPSFDNHLFHLDASLWPNREPPKSA